MSIKVMSAVWEQSKAEGGTLLVLLALADYADQYGVCWPTLEAIGKRARLSTRQVIRATRQLSAMGELTIQRHAAAGFRDDRRPNRYEVTMCHVVAPRGDKMSPTGVTPEVPRGDMGVTLTVSLEPSENTHTGEFEEFWSAYPKKHAKLDAQKAWRQTASQQPPLSALLAALARDGKTEQWRRGVIPHAGTWLRGARWLDEAGNGVPPRRREFVRADAEFRKNYEADMRRMASDVGRKMS